MLKFFKWLLVSLVAIAVVVFVVFRYMKVQTKKASPEESVTFFLSNPDSLQVSVTYCRPYKKGRVIFGGLVPYDVVWRTGANEATTFTVDKDIRFGYTPVKAGTYTLWSLPGKDQWTVFLNSKSYSWGVDLDGHAQRDPVFDVAAAVVRPVALNEEVEQFTILMATDTSLVLRWDRTEVAVPITR